MKLYVEIGKPIDCSRNRASKRWPAATHPGYLIRCIWAMKTSIPYHRHDRQHDPENTPATQRLNPISAYRAVVTLIFDSAELPDLHKVKTTITRFPGSSWRHNTDSLEFSP